MELRDQLKVTISLHKKAQNRILERPVVTRFSYVSIFRVPLGMLNQHSFESPFSPVFAISRVMLKLSMQDKANKGGGFS